MGLIINNTISAFDATKDMDIIFSGSGNSIFAVRVKYNGESQLIAGDYITKSVQVTTDLNLSLQNYKKVVISAHDVLDGEFPINTPLQVSIAEISGTDASKWVWSDTVIKYALPEPILYLIGGIFEKPYSATDADIGNAQILSDVKISDDGVCSIMGELKFNDDAEYDEIASFEIKSRDLAYTSERQYPDRDWDPNCRKFYYRLTELKNGQVLTLAVRTRKGYIFTTDFNVIYSTSIANKQVALFFGATNQENGEIKVKSIAAKGSNLLSAQLTNNTNDTIDATLHYFRALTTTFPVWQEFAQQTVDIPADSSKMILFEDKTIEGGKSYDYKIVASYVEEQVIGGIVKKESYNAAMTSTPTTLAFDDIFLLTKNTTLKLSYNPQITNYKRNIQTVITPTLGGAYPFARRNGAQKYHSFTLSALLSYENELFINDDYSALTLSDVATNMFAGSGIMNQDNIPVGIDQVDSALSWSLVERAYRDKVLDFLYSGKIMLFKSFTEGNMFVILSDVSLTPNQTLGRNIYSFSATVTEILPATGENCIKYFSEDTRDDIAYEYTRLYALWANTSSATATDAEEILNTGILQTPSSHVTTDATTDPDTVQELTLVQDSITFNL